MRLRVRQYVVASAVGHGTKTTVAALSSGTMAYFTPPRTKQQDLDGVPHCIAKIRVGTTLRQAYEAALAGPGQRRGSML